MNSGIAETKLNAQNAAGQPFHPEHLVRVEWQRIHEFQYDYCISLDGSEIDCNSVRDLSDMWDAYQAALKRVWW